MLSPLPSLPLAVWILLASACASSGSQSRELPSGLSDLGALLDGCTTSGAAETGLEVICGDAVMTVKRRNLPAGDPTWRAVAYGLAQASGARLTWDRVRVPTEALQSEVDRGRAVRPDETVAGTLVGAARTLTPGLEEEVWCVARAPEDEDRCRELVGGVLSLHQEVPAPTPSGDDDDKAVKKPAPGPSHRFYGRAISVPTTCAVQVNENGDGSGSCTDAPARLQWQRFDTMDDALTVVALMFESRGVGEEEGEQFACKLAGEAAECEQKGDALTALAYVEGKPVVAVCSGIPGDQLVHGLCRALVNRR